MRIILAKSLSEAIERTVAQVLNQIKEQPKSVIGLATGRTMEPVYELWVKAALAQAVDHSQCRFFMLDEYLGIPDTHAGSFRHYIATRLERPLQLKQGQVCYPPVDAMELDAAAGEYEQAIAEAGGIDLQLLGVGQNGHVGFNEPGSMGNSRTRVVNLTAETIAANQASFGSNPMPGMALSMGISTILQSKQLLLLATGTSKARVIKYLLNHHDEPEWPVTFLKRHQNFNLVLDPESASAINLKL
jgi:glucosamine-6-phosphate deaminase